MVFSGLLMVESFWNGLTQVWTGVYGWVPYQPNQLSHDQASSAQMTLSIYSRSFIIYSNILLLYWLTLHELLYWVTLLAYFAGLFYWSMWLTYFTDLLYWFTLLTYITNLPVLYWLYCLTFLTYCNYLLYWCFKYWKASSVVVSLLHPMHKCFISRLYISLTFFITYFSYLL